MNRKKISGAIYRQEDIANVDAAATAETTAPDTITLSIFLFTILLSYCGYTFAASVI